MFHVNDMIQSRFAIQSKNKSHTIVDFFLVEKVRTDSNQPFAFLTHS